jgi:hypothetical protein
MIVFLLSRQESIYISLLFHLSIFLALLTEQQYFRFTFGWCISRILVEVTGCSH